MAKYFNKNLKYIRKKLDLSQEEIAKKMGIDRTTISRWENDKMDVTVDNAILTAKVLNIPIIDFLCKDLTIDDDIDFELFFEKNREILTKEDKEEIITGIDISSDYGWMGKEDIAVIHYDNVPLNGKMSDLTARFFVRKISEDELTLAFIDLHVM